MDFIKITRVSHKDTRTVCPNCGHTLLFSSTDNSFFVKTINGSDLVVFLDKPANMTLYMQCSRCGSHNYLTYNKKKLTGVDTSGII